MSDWAKVLTELLGLAGFVLFLVFGFSARLKRRDEKSSLSSAAVIVAVTALVGGVSFAYLQANRQKAATQPSSSHQVDQIVVGTGSPIVSGEHGNVTITITDEFSAIDRVLQTLPTGNIAFNVPNTMFLGQTSRVRLLLSPRKSIAELQSDLQKQVAGQQDLRGAQINIAPEMEARLSGQDFQIMAVTPERQALSGERETEWDWDVTPKKTGTEELHLTLNAFLTVNNHSMSRAIQTFDKRIEVRVTLGKRIAGFVGGNWQWLWTVLGVPLGAWLSGIWKKRRLKSGEASALRKKAKDP